MNCCAPPSLSLRAGRCALEPWSAPRILVEHEEAYHVAVPEPSELVAGAKLHHCGFSDPSAASASSVGVLATPCRSHLNDFRKIRRGGHALTGIADVLRQYDRAHGA